MQGRNFCEILVALNKQTEGWKDSHSMMEMLHVLGILKIKKQQDRSSVIGYTGFEVQIFKRIIFSLVLCYAAFILETNVTYMKSCHL